MIEEYPLLLKNKSSNNLDFFIQLLTAEFREPSEA